MLCIYIHIYIYIYDHLRIVIMQTIPAKQNAYP